MSQLLNILISVIGWALFIFNTIFWHLVGLLIMFPVSVLKGDKTRGPVHWAAMMWAKTLVWLSPHWEFEITGREHLEPGKPYLIIANHQSALDIFAVLIAFGGHFKFLAKKELFKTPFLGWHMSLAGYIPIDRGNKESAKNAMMLAGKWLERGVSLLFFPEGTRSLDYQIHNYKLGAFRLAEEKNVPVLPLVIDGTGDALAKKSYVLKKRSKLRVSIGEPVTPEKLGAEGVASYAIKVRELMTARLAAMRKTAE